MYLIDTSVWIDYFRQQQSPPTDRLILILDQNIPFGITSAIFQEILQGAANRQEFEQLSFYFSTQRFYHPQSTTETYCDAAKLYFNCRRQGLTIRSTIDCLIAQIAIENNLILLHNDNDYALIKSINPDLHLF